MLSYSEREQTLQHVVQYLHQKSEDKIKHTALTIMKTA